MAGEALPLVQKLARLAEIAGENPAALRELMPLTGEAAAPIPMEKLSQPDVTDLLTRVRGRLAEWLSGRVEAPPGPFSKPAASMLKAAPTAPPPGAPAMQAPSPQKPLGAALAQKLAAYEPYGREYGEVAQDAPVAPPEPSSAASRTLAQALAGQSGPPQMSQGPSMTSTAEALRRPAGGERSEVIGRVRDLLQQLKGGSEEAMPELQRIKPQLQPPAAVLPPEVKAGLTRMGGLPGEAELPVDPDMPVTRYPYRGAPRRGTANVPPEERFRSEGLKQTSLPPEMQDFINQLQESGQLPKDVSSQENTMRALLAKLYGYKPRALLGGQKQVGEAASSRIGLALKRFSELSPEEITRVLQSVKPSGIYRLGRVQEAAEQAAPAYQALGESRPAEEIVADLLRGGPSPTGTGEFAEKVLYPIAKRRGRLGLQPGEPLTLENVIGALRGSGFLRSNRPSAPREQLIAKVMQMMKERGVK